MYSIYADDLCIYNDISPLENLKVISPKLIMEDSAAGSLSMTVPPVNVGYNVITKLSTDIIVYKDGKEIWAGRVLSEDKDFFNNRILYCEGELAFLNDSTQPQAEYHDITVRGFLETLLNVHNSKVSDNRKFYVGAVTVTDSNDSLYRYTNYEKTIECINDKLVERLGGHIRVRKVNGKRYIDYLADYPNTNSQIIEFGKNLTNFTKSWDLTDFATVILPLGNRLEESQFEALDSYLTVSSVNGGSIYVASAEAVANYGWIEKVVHWDDVSTASSLLSKARKYLSSVQFDDMTIELSALDLHYLDINCEDIKLLDQIRVLSRPHGMDRYFPIKKLEIPLDSPDNTLITLGDSIKATLTSVNNQINSDILKNIEELPKASSILNQAKANATAIMRMATNGYITITQDENGSNSLYVSDTQDYREATRYWLLNMNGFGYSGDGGETFGLAITMDGAIVADYITAGVLNGDLLRAGSVSASAISQTYKNSVSNSINSAKLLVEQEFAAADGELLSSISEVYATKTELSVISSSITQTASTIRSEVRSTYATKTELSDFSTSITQTTDSITTQVNRKVNASEFGTYMQQNYNSFLLGFNGNSNVIQITSTGIDIYDGTINDNNRMIRFNSNGMDIWRTGTRIGRIGTNSWTGYPDYRGLVFDLEYEGKYMTWARKTSTTADTYTAALTYARAGAAFGAEGLFVACTLYMRGNRIDRVNLTNVSAGGYGTFTGTKTFITAIRSTEDGGIEWDTATYSINNGMFIN